MCVCVCVCVVCVCVVWCCVWCVCVCVCGVCVCVCVCVPGVHYAMGTKMGNMFGPYKGNKLINHTELSFFIYKCRKFNVRGRFGVRG